MPVLADQKSDRWPEPEDLPRIAVVIPVYNHPGQVRLVAEEVRELGWPVFIVNDGSTDSTADVLKTIKGVTVLHHEQNLGKGAALMTGFTAAVDVADWVVTMDADGQHKPEDISVLINAVPYGYRPLVIGRRQGMHDDNVPWTSRWGRKFSNFWVWAASGLWVTDSQSGFRLYPLPDTLLLKPKARRFEFEVEIIALAGWSRVPVIEIPVQVTYLPPGQRISHFKPGLDFWRNTLTFGRLIFKRLLIPRFFRARKVQCAP